MNILNRNSLLEVHAAALALSLNDNRAALLTGIHPEFAATLHQIPSPNGQLLTDLELLNRAGILMDGSVPLATWLENAAVLAGQRPETAVFLAARKQCPQTQSTTNVSPMATEGRIDQNAQIATPTAIIEPGSMPHVVKVELRLNQPLRTFNEIALKAALTILLGSPVTNIHITSIREGSTIVTLKGNQALLSSLVRALSEESWRRKFFVCQTRLMSVSWVIGGEEHTLDVQGQESQNSSSVTIHGSGIDGSPIKVLTDASQIDTGLFSVLQNGHIVGKVLVTPGDRPGSAIEYWWFYNNYQSPREGDPAPIFSFIPEVQGLESLESLEGFVQALPRDTNYLVKNVDLVVARGTEPQGEEPSVQVANVPTFLRHVKALA